VWDLRPITSVITEYQHHTVCCPLLPDIGVRPSPSHGRSTRRLGLCVTALVELLRGEYYQSEWDVCAFLNTLCALPITLGSVVRWYEHASDAFVRAYSGMAESVREQTVANVDETRLTRSEQARVVVDHGDERGNTVCDAASRGTGALNILLGDMFGASWARTGRKLTTACQTSGDKSAGRISIVMCKHWLSMGVIKAIGPRRCLTRATRFGCP